MLAPIHGVVAPLTRQAAVAEVFALADRIVLLVDAQPVRQVELALVVVAAVVDDDPAYIIR